MKAKWIMLKKYMPWLLLLLFMDLFFCLLLWITDSKSLYTLSLTIVLFSLILFLCILFFVISHERNLQNAYKDYITSPTEINEETLLELSSDSDKQIIQLMGNTLKAKEQEINLLYTKIEDYEEYVEVWAHETKTPISLLTLVLDNHDDEIPDNISTKMNYIRNRMQEYVEQMLFYARLKGEKKDIFFETLNLGELLDDILKDYQPLFEEKHFSIRKEALETTVFSDKRGLGFLLSQIISNSIKYTQKGKLPELKIRFETGDKYNILSVKDNGMGVKACDMPYIFEKGFTGDSGDSRKRATGMGLYLGKEMAKSLHLQLDAQSQWMHGFLIRIMFPII